LSPLHNFDAKVTDMTCLPDKLAVRTYYQPTDQGFEQRPRARLDEIRKLKSNRCLNPEVL
jgi:putative ATPase